MKKLGDIIIESIMIGCSLIWVLFLGLIGLYCCIWIFKKIAALVM